MALLGYGWGSFAPGVQNPAEGQYLTAHNLLKAHAEAYHVYDQQFREAQKGGLKHCHETFSGKSLTSNVEITKSVAVQ